MVCILEYNYTSLSRSVVRRERGPSGRRHGRAWTAAQTSPSVSACCRSPNRSLQHLQPTLNGQKRFTRVEFPTTSKMPAFCSSVSVSYCAVGRGPCAIANNSETLMGREKTYREAFDLQSRSSALHSPPCTASRGSACKTNHSTAQALGQEPYDGLEERSQILQPEAA